MYLQHIGRFSNVQYDDGFYAWDMRHSQDLIRGESLSNNPTLSYHPNSYCLPSEDQAADKYNCGKTLAWVFWELANNLCAQSYDSCFWHNDLIQNGVPQYAPWEYANWAYAYAASMIGPTSVVDEFMMHVKDKYTDFRDAGWISTDDLKRVVSVISHHCLDTSECTTGLFITCQTARCLRRTLGRHHSGKRRKPTALGTRSGCVAHPMLQPADTWSSHRER